MKKLFSLGLAFVAAILIFTGCIKFDNSGTSKFDPEKIKTMQDVFAYGDFENSNEGYTEKNYVFVFKYIIARLRNFRKMFRLKFGK